MGDLTYRNAEKVFDDLPLTRIYAPVGSKKELLPYLVRRLLENGANSSFVNKYLSSEVPVSEVVKNPIKIANANLQSGAFLENVKRPHEIFIDRKNSKGFDYADAENLKNLNSEFEDFSSIKFVAKSILADDLDLKELPKKNVLPRE